MTVGGSAPRVLVVPDWYPSPERPVHGLFCREHARAAARAGHDVVVLAREDGHPRIEDRVEAGLRVVRVHLPRVPAAARTLTQLAAVGAGFRYLRRRGWYPDVVHAHVFSSGALALPFARRARAAVVISEHLTSITRGHLGRRDVVALRRAYRWADRVLPCSEDLARRIAVLEPRARLEVMPNVVDPERFHPPDNPPPPGERLLVVAFLNEKKGVADLLEALARLAPARPHLTLDVIGDGPDRMSLEHRVHRLRLDGRVHFHGLGRPDEVAAAMRRADLFVLPSHVENAPVVLIEAGASGLRVVATAVGGVPEIVDATWGELVPPADPPALAAAVDRGLTRAAGNRAAISQRVLARHGLDVVGARWTAVYEAVLRERRRAAARPTRST